jgi:hypothetical protein
VLLNLFKSFYTCTVHRYVTHALDVGAVGNLIQSCDGRHCIDVFKEA